MVMLTGAFDVSYDEPLHRFLILAGFVSSAERWADYDVAWRNRLAIDGLPYFQMRQFAHSVGIFDGWRDKEEKRRRLLYDLLDILSAHAFHKFAIVIQASAFGVLSEESRKELGDTLITAAGNCLVAQMNDWRLREKIEGDVEYIFEDGDEDWGALEKTIKTVTGKRPIRRPKKDDPRKGVLAFTPLHSSDIIAYEVKKVTDEIGKELPMKFEFRFPYRQLRAIPGQAMIFNADTAAIVERDLKAYRESHKNVQ
jgi:hypothetical protein